MIIALCLFASFVIGCAVAEYWLESRHELEMRRAVLEARKAGFLEGRMDRSAAPFTVLANNPPAA